MHPPPPGKMWQCQGDPSGLPDDSCPRRGDVVCKEFWAMLPTPSPRLTCFGTLGFLP